MVTLHEPVADCVAMPPDTEDAQAIVAWLSWMSTTPPPSGTKPAPGNSCSRLVDHALAPELTPCGTAIEEVAFTQAEPLMTTLCAGSLSTRTSGVSAASNRRES